MTYLNTIEDLEKLYYSEQNFSSDAGYYKLTHSKQVWELGKTCGVLSILPRELWKESAFRAVGDRHSKDNVFEIIQIRHKTVAHTFNIETDIIEEKGTKESIIKTLGRHHNDILNELLIEGENPKDPTSLDYIIRSREEILENQLVDRLYPVRAQGQNAWIDRGKEKFSWATSQTINANGELKQEHIDEIIRAIISRGGTPKVILHRGHKEIADFIQKTISGKLDTKIIQIDQIPTDKIFILDTDYISLRFAKPTQFFDAKDEYVFRTMLETVCRHFGAQGKIYNISPPKPTKEEEKRALEILNVKN